MLRGAGGVVQTHQHFMRSTIKFHLKNRKSVKYDSTKFNNDEVLLTVQKASYGTLSGKNDERPHHN